MFVYASFAPPPYDHKMGIQGLTTFVEENFNGWERKELRGKLVLDGNSVCHQLHQDNHIQWVYGGQYGQFRAAVLHFIDRLRSNDISPVLVFDGIDYKRQKTEVMLRRRTEWVRCISDTLTGVGRECSGVRILPLVTTEVFREALEEREVPYYFVDGEADPDTVALANHYCCPVVSNDSDYYMFNVDAGYIPMSRLNWKSNPVVADIYFKANFSSTSRLAPELCLAIPAIVGNDFMSTVMYNHLRDDIGGDCRRCSVKLLVNYLARFRSLDDLLHHIGTLRGGDRCLDHLKANYQQAKEFYSITHVITEERLMASTELCFSGGSPLPDWILRQYRQGYFVHSLMEPLVLGSSLLRVVPDDPHSDTAHYCSRPIRQACYGILAPQMRSAQIEEVVRHQLQLRKELVESVSCVGDLELPIISSIPSLSPERKMAVVCSVLGCNLEGLERKWELVVAASCYWAREVKPSRKQVRALVLTFLKCSAGCYNHPKHGGDRPPAWMKSFHVYAQWQCVYFDAMKLNNILLNPLRFVSPALLFDGNMVMHYVLRRDLDSIIRRELNELKSTRLFDRLVSAITAALPAQEGKRPGKPKAQPAKPTAAKAATGGGVASTNRFALLSVDDSESESENED